MALVAAKCSQCGASIQVEDSAEKGVCPYCGTEYYAEKIINNTYVTNNYSGATINVQGIDVQNYLEIATKFYNQKNYEEAMKYLSDAFPIEPNNGKLWLLKLKILSAKLQLAMEVVRDDLVGTLREIKNSSIEKDIIILKEALEELYSLHIFYAKEEEKISGTKGLENKTQKQLDKVTLNAEIMRIIMQNIIFEDDCPEMVIDVFLKLDMEQLKKQRPGYFYSLMGYSVAMAELYHVTFFELPELKVKGKKGEDKTPSYLGTYLLYLIKNRYPNYSSPVLYEAEKLMDSKEKAGCYIATCVYGSYDCSQVWTLRRFRDDILAETGVGRLFIQFYYMLSPKLVECFGETRWFKNFWRKILDKMVLYFQSKGMDSTPYEDRVW